MSRPALVAAALLLSSACPPVSAHVHWLCGLSDDMTRLVCLADVDPAADPVPSITATTAVVRGTAFPLDPGRPWIVPLWSPASDADFVELLARASICYRTPACAVTVMTPWSRQVLRSTNHAGVHEPR